MPPSTISGINQLDPSEKRAVYSRIIPPELIQHFNLGPDLTDEQGRHLLDIRAEPGSTSAEMYFFHHIGFPDPVLYGQLQDTLNGQIHILLYILNDPEAPRFDVDKLPDGTPTQFGTRHRNIEAELAAMRAGLAPGQVRRGLRLLGEAIVTFEQFILTLGHDLHFAEPLYYHNAILFERYGYAYQQGRRLMQRIQEGFSPGGDLLPLLDSSTPFRMPEAANSIRLRSWAIHDGILGKPYTDVTMYKRAGVHAEVQTCEGCTW